MSSAPTPQRLPQAVFRRRRAAPTVACVPRKPRIEFPGAIYHVSAQANRSEALFFGVDDFRIFHYLLCYTSDRHEWQVHSWCYMTTHYHLLLTTPNGDLARGMHRLNSRYAHWFNDTYGEKGHVFRRRYNPVLVETDKHLRSCYRYIARNPVKAGICTKPAEWRWSSYGWLFGSTLWKPDLPSHERELYRHFDHGGDARQCLRQLVEGPNPDDPDTSGAWHPARP
jgi:REP element-mobilizing transposase RayT